MSAKFIISFDCEGKWGFADNVTSHHRKYLTNNNLRDAYQQLLFVLDEYDINATFAFVMAMVMTKAERTDNPQFLDEVPFSNGDWLAIQRLDSSDGWFCPELLEMVLDKQCHEIASHGFSHVPLTEEWITRDAAISDLSKANEVAKLKGLDLRTLVFPRNMIGYTELLRQFNYIGYREDNIYPETTLKNALREINVLGVSQKNPDVSDQIVPIPSGYMLNWRFGARNRIPLEVTTQRWRSILNNAVKSNGIAHLWLHPHNIIDAPSTLESLTRILRLVDELQQKGSIEVVTQEQYAQQLLTTYPGTLKLA